MIDKSKLKERVKYFFKSHSHERSEVGVFINDLKPLGEIAVFGGMLRDLSCGGNKSFFLDVDLVIDSKEKGVLGNFLKKYQVKKNSFGGHRIFLNRWKIDLWQLEETWAFRENHIHGSNLDNLVKTTFFTWDAIIYKVNTGSVYHIDNYFELLKSGVIDINFEANKNPLGIATRALQLSLKNSAKLSPRLVKYILHQTEGKSTCELFKKISRNSIQNKIAIEKFELTLRKLKEHSLNTPHTPFKVENEQLSLCI